MADSTDQVSLSIAVIDDDPDGLQTLGEYLSARNHKVHLASNGRDGLAILQHDPIDMVITDLKMPDINGFEVLREVRKTHPTIEVIMITAFGDVEGAVRAMREGAFDFFTKPFDVRDLHAALQRTMRFRALRQEKDRYRTQLDHLGFQARARYGLDSIIGQSQVIRDVRAQIQQVAETETTTVLIQGETGTGKELVARAIHYESARRSAAFVAVDCSAIPSELVESA
ncbi:MAG: response regulator, partial [Candidatus Latescibacteria bacterium]|nr:response regulator [Candidatus Latescibacterota bacterium]